MIRNRSDMPLSSFNHEQEGERKKEAAVIVHRNKYIALRSQDLSPERGNYEDQRKTTNSKIVMDIYIMKQKQGKLGTIPWTVCRRKNQLLSTLTFSYQKK